MFTKFSWLIKSYTEDAIRQINISRRESRAAATFKMEGFVITVNGWKLLTIITKRFILDVAAALDPRLIRSILIKVV